MKFIEIGNYIINVDKIEKILRIPDDDRVQIMFSNDQINDSIIGDGTYYYKLMEILKPIQLSNIKENSVNDFPGDNMIEE